MMPRPSSLTTTDAKSSARPRTAVIDLRDVWTAYGPTLSETTLFNSALSELGRPLPHQFQGLQIHSTT